MVNKVRLTLEIDPSLNRRLKETAAERGVSVRELCLQAIEHWLLDPRRVLILHPGDPLAELWDNEEDAVYDNL
jgi:hypothetical protein